MRPHASLLLPLLLVLFVGCPRPSTPAPPKTLVEWFKQKNANVQLPHGSIDMDSVRLEGEDTVVYQTTDGKKWKQKYKQTGEGEYEKVGDLTKVSEKPETD